MQVDRIRDGLTGRIKASEAPPEVAALQSLAKGLKAGDGFFAGDRALDAIGTYDRLQHGEDVTLRHNGQDSPVATVDEARREYADAMSGTSIPLATGYQVGQRLACRPTGVEHFDTYEALDRLCFEHPYPPDVLRHYLTNPGTEAVVATVDEGAIGYYVLGRDRVEPHTANLDIIGITPQAQGRKAGEHLLMQVIEHARQNGAARCYLEVDVKNIPAQHLYEKFHFKTTELVKDCFAPGRDAWRMCLDF